MPLSDRTKTVLQIKTDSKAGPELATAINRQAAAVAAIGATTNLVAPGAIVDAAPLVGTEARLDVIEARVDAVIAALKNAGLMAAV